MLDADSDKETPDEIKKRIAEMHDLIENVSGWYDEIKRLPTSTLQRMMKMGARIAKFVPKRAA